jgi:hypothetical protein
MSQHGGFGFCPKCQFAAVQRYGRRRWNTGRSVNMADTTAADRSSSPSRGSGFLLPHLQLVFRLSNDSKPKTLVEQARAVVLHHIAPPPSSQPAGPTRAGMTRQRKMRPIRKDTRARADRRP